MIELFPHWWGAFLKFFQLVFAWEHISSERTCACLCYHWNWPRLCECPPKTPADVSHPWSSRRQDSSWPSLPGEPRTSPSLTAPGSWLLSAHFVCSSCSVGSSPWAVESWRVPLLLISPAMKSELCSVSKEMSPLTQTSSASSIKLGPVFKEWIGLPWWSSGKESAC